MINKRTYHAKMFKFIQCSPFCVKDNRIIKMIKYGNVILLTIFIIMFSSCGKNHNNSNVIDNIDTNSDNDVSEIISISHDLDKFKSYSEQNPNIFSKYYKDNNNILHLSILYEFSSEIVDYIINNSKLNINSINDRKETPLHIAIFNNQPLLMIKLINNGADINCIDNKGCTPLHRSLLLNKYDFAKILLENNANVNIKDNHGKSPIFYSFNNKQIINILIDMNANVNIYDNSGATPLHHSVLFNNYEISSILIQNSANINVKDNNGYTPLHLSVKNNNLEITKLLLSNGADVNVKNSKGLKPIDYTKSQELFDILKQ